MKIVLWAVVVTAAVLLAPGMVVLAALAFVIARAARWGWSR